jgi:2-pyrone-4,6-dicarboxylate lactonase
MDETLATGAVIRPPHQAPPHNSCDCQIHVYGDPAKYKITNPQYQLRPNVSYEDSVRVHDALGIDRCVIVQTAVYRTDHSYLLDVLARAPKDRYRAVAIIDDGVTDAEIRRLHEAGVRGARFNFARFLGIRPDPAEFWRSLDRIRDYGWMLKLHAVGSELLELEELLRRIKDPVVLDHMGHLHAEDGLQQPAMRLILDLLRNQDNWWIMLSNGALMSHQKSGWDEAVPFGHALYEAAPDRAIWASDFPYPGVKGPHVPEHAEFLELLYRYLPDRQAREQVLVHNPARLFGFA